MLSKKVLKSKLKMMKKMLYTEQDEF